LKSSPQQKVKDRGHTIMVEPAQNDVVYVPQYDPWLAYGDPLSVFPGWYPYPGLYFDGPGIGFGLGFGVGLFSGFGWGWHHWDLDWRHHGRVDYNHNTYISHSTTIVNRNSFRAGQTNFNHGMSARGSVDGHQAFRGPEPGGSRGTTAMHSGAFGGFTQGGIARSNAFRGQSSFGGFHSGGFNAGGGFHGGGGGGFRGGGGGRR
jgi:hypothetical protein